MKNVTENKVTEEVAKNGTAGSQTTGNQDVGQKTDEQSSTAVPERKFFPKDMLEVFAVEEMVPWGYDNLDRLGKYWAERVQKSSVKSSDYPLEVANCYLKNIITAKSLAVKFGTNIPLVPDLRLKDWIKPGDHIIVRQIDVDYQRRQVTNFYAVADRIEESSNSGLVDIYPRFNPKDIKTTNGDVDYLIENCAYELCSAHVMKPSEVEYFLEHLDDLRVWLDLCGMHNPGFQLISEVKDAIMEDFTKNVPDSSEATGKQQSATA